MKTNSIAVLLQAGLVSMLAMVGQAHATLVLTTDGINDGFSLTTFYTDPNAYYGVIGLANASDGTVLATGYARSQVYKFNDADGQSYGSALNTVSISGTVAGMATAGGKVYASTVAGQYYQVSDGLSITPLTLSPGAAPYYGLWGNQVTGHLLSSSYAGLIDIDPLTGTWTAVGPSGADGVTVSPNGKTAYGEFGGAIVGYDIATATLVYNSGALGHGPDGTGVISGGQFSGDIIVNNNDGTVGLLDPSGINPYTIIATGGTRGDFVSPDLSNGTLFLATADSVLRLSCGKDCAIGSTPPPSGVPEPDALALFGIGILGLSLSRLRKAG